MEMITTFNNNALTDKALKVELSTIRKAIETGNTASWSIAKSFHSIVVGELFSADFESLGNFAKAIGVSKSVISRDVNAYAIASKLSLTHWTLSSVIELLPLCSNESIGIEELHKVAEELQKEGAPSRNKVREYVRQLLKELTPAQEAEAEAEDEAEVVDTQARVDELEALRAEVKALKAEVAKLTTELEGAKHEAKVQEDKHNSLRDLINEARTITIGKQEIQLALDDVKQIVTEYLEGSEVEA